MKRLFPYLATTIIVLNGITSCHTLVNTYKPETEILDNHLYGKLTKVEPKYSDEAIDHFLVTVETHDLYNTSPKEVLVYMPPGYSESQLQEIIKKNYCVGITLDPTRYTQISYRVITDILLIKQNCE
jgi:hypothetical protein